MNQIQTTYINALLADAVYVEGVAVGEVIASQFQKRLSTTQAAYLAANFEVVRGNWGQIKISLRS